MGSRCDRRIAIYEEDVVDDDDSAVECSNAAVNSDVADERASATVGSQMFSLKNIVVSTAAVSADVSDPALLSFI